MPDQNSDFTAQLETWYDRMLSALHKLQDIRPSTRPTNDACGQLYDRVRCTRLALLWPFLKAFLILLDIGLDLKVALTHYEHGEHHWARGTIAIVVITEVFIQVTSVYFFAENNEDDDTKNASKENGLEVRLWAVSISHLLFLGRFVRFYQTWKVAHNIRSEGRYENLENDMEARNKFIRSHRLYLKQITESNILGLIEAFFENAPQVLFQFYVLLGHGHVDLTSRDDLLVTLNIVKSLLIFAFGHLSYTRSLRKESEKSGQLALFSMGAVLLYLWRFLMLLSRMLVLGLFYSTFGGGWSGVLTVLHYVLFLRIIYGQYCGDYDYLQFAIAYIYTFSYFPFDSVSQNLLCILYYCTTFAENSFIMLVWWSFFSSWGYTSKLIAVLVEKISFFVAFICMVLYYGCFHPGKR